MDLIQGKMEIAVKYGADVAIFMHNVVYWVEKNQANGINFRDGRYWTFNSMEALCKLYPLWSRDQIKRLIAKCKDFGLLIVGEFNQDRRDRTKWYSPSDEILAFYGPCKSAQCTGRNRQMQMAQSPHTDGEIAPPLPSIDQDNTDIPPYNPPMGDKPARKRSKRRGPKQAPDWKPERFEGFWRMYPVKKSKQAAIRAWDKLKPDDALLAVMGRTLQRQMRSQDWQEGFAIPYPATWINGRRWEDEVDPAPTHTGGWAEDREVTG